MSAMGIHQFQNLFWTAYNYFEAGGLVMIPLAAVSLWLWTLIVVKLLDLARIRRADPDAALKVFELRPQDLKSWPGLMVREFRTWRTGMAAADRKLAESLALRFRLRMERHVDTILVLATAAPLIGLLGTVTGMISTFTAISDYGAGNARALAGGISEALITTQGGLMVALPGMFMGNFIRRRVERTQARIDRFGLALVKPETEEGARS